MGIKKFIKKVKLTLGLNGFKKEGKKKSIKTLLKMLNDRKKDIKRLLKGPLMKKEKKELTEEFEIICLLQEKGKKILYELYTTK